MSDTSKNNFHEFSLKSSLFKGRIDLYFCYLKSEKIAHALIRLLTNFDSEGRSVEETLLRASAHLPASIIRFAAGEFEETSVLVDVFELLSLVRLGVSHHILDEKNAEIIVQEYEGIAEKISLGKNVSPFLTLEDLAVPPFTSAPQGSKLLQNKNPLLSRGGPIKDTKGQSEGHVSQENHQRQSERTLTILKIVNENKRVSIKDISKVIKNCSEKTIQRELNVLIQQGLVRKEGERRWSTYIAVGVEM